jgi:anti-sigma regulatory factor (Ser/Thr protein kinase)
MKTQWFSAAPEQVRPIRLAVERTLSELGCPPDSTGTAALLVNELASNVVEHTNSDRIGLVVVRRGDVARIEITDCDPDAPAPTAQPVDPARPRGRGLHIVDALSLDWGVTMRAAEKTVWVEVPCVA